MAAIAISPNNSILVHSNTAVRTAIRYRQQRTHSFITRPAVVGPPAPPQNVRTRSMYAHLGKVEFDLHSSAHDHVGVPVTKPTWYPVGRNDPVAVATDSGLTAIAVGVAVVIWWRS